jgi:hypothetical protein
MEVNILNIVIHIILVSLILKVSTFISQKLQSDKYFVSVAYIAVLLLFILKLVLHTIFSYDIVFSPFIERVLVTTFLFGIGYQIGAIYLKNHWKRMINLLVLCTFSLLLLKISSQLFDGYWLSTLLDSIFFAYNNDLRLMVVSHERLEQVYIIAMAQTALLFFLTPIFLCIIERKLEKSKSRTLNLQIHPKTTPINKNMFMFLSIILLSILIVTIKISFFLNSPLFIYDYVISMILGFTLSKWGQKHLSKEEEVERNTSIQKLGTFALYGFLITSVYQITENYWTVLGIEFIYAFLIKFILIGAIIFIFVTTFMKSLSYEETLVAIVAGWTFTQGSPYICMHGMRSAVNKVGAAPNVLLIVPPVILWLVNYVHLFIYFLW